jgi:hypothetical protein
MAEGKFTRAERITLAIAAYERAATIAADAQGPLRLPSSSIPE